MDELILGMSNQVSQAMDEAVTSEVKQIYCVAPQLNYFLRKIATHSKKYKIIWNFYLDAIFQLFFSHAR